MKLIIIFTLFIISVILNFIFIRRESFLSSYDKAFNIDYDVPINQYQAEVNIDYIDNILKKIKNPCMQETYIESSLTLQETYIKGLLTLQEDDEPNRLIYISDSTFSFPNTYSLLPHYDTKMKLNKLYESYLEETSKYLLSLFTFIKFEVVYQDIQNIKILNTGCILKSTHIIYRQNKLYGFAIELITMHKKEINIIDYTIIGTVLEDKINLLYADKEDNQVFLDDHTITEDETYINNYLCKKYADIKKYNGISVDNPTVKC